MWFVAVFYARRVLLALLLVPALWVGLSSEARAQSISPVVSIEVLGAHTVTEGSPARFRISMDPAPSAAFNVAIHVAESGRVRRVSYEDYAGHVAESALGLKKVAIPTSGHLDYPVNTAAQTALERDTSVLVHVIRPTDTVTNEVGGGLGDYRTSFVKPQSAEVTVRDGPDTAPARTPDVTVRPVFLEVAEGEDAVFWLIAEPAPAADLTVNLTVAGWNGILQDGEGTRTVTIPAGEPWARGSADLRLRTVDDNEADGMGDRVTVTVNTGSGYTVGDIADFPGGPPYRLGMRQATVTVVDGGSGAPPVTPTAAPDTPVGNVRITALDAASAKVTWDAVPRASAYLVEWEVRGTQANRAGADSGVTETSLVIAHGAADATSLSVRVVPWYTNEQGQARLLHALAGTATLDLPAPGDTLVRGQSDEVSAGAGTTTGTVTAADPAVVKMVEDMIMRHRDVTGNAGALAKWRKALKTLKREPGGFTVAALEARVERLSGKPKQRWQRVLDAVKAMQAGSDGTSIKSTITVSSGAAVTEGGAAGFSLAADPVPTADLTVKVAISQTGNHVSSANLGTRTVTIPAGKASAAFTVDTVGDNADKPDGAVIAAVLSGTDYAVGDAGVATVPVHDDDATKVTLSAAAGDIAEALGRKLLRLQLGRALVKGETLAVPLALGGTASLGTDYTLQPGGNRRKGVSHTNLESRDSTAPPTVTFTGPSGKSATLMLVTTTDSVNEGASETVTVGFGTLTATGLGGGASGSGTVAFAILEKLLPEISIAAKTASISEGQAATFTVMAHQAPEADLTVNLTVSEADSSDTVAADSEGAATVIIAKGKTDAVFTVATVNDSQDEPDGAVTVTLTADGSEEARYTVAASPKDAASVAVADDDAPAPVSALSVADVTANEGVGRMWFTVKLSPAADRPVSVGYSTRESTPVSAQQGQDYLRAGWSLSFAPGETEKRFWVYIYNDSHDEDPETFEVVLSNARGATIARGMAIGTIVNSDPMPKAWLSRFGRTVAQQALDGIAGRLTAPRTPGAQGTVAGQSLTFASASGNAGNGAATLGADTPARTQQGLLALAQVAQGFGSRDDRFSHAGFGTERVGGPGALAQSTLTAREVLLGSHFTATGQPDAAGGSMALWGRAALASFDGREGAFSLDGDVTTGLLGADYARDRWLVGVALLHSAGEGDYRDTATGPPGCPAAMEVLCNRAVRAGEGAVETSLTAGIPYAAWQATERVRLWGAAGYGAGDVTLTTGTGMTLKTDIDWTMAAAGLRGILLQPLQGTGPALALTSDALWAGTASEKTQKLAASDSDVTRLRLGLEGSWGVALAEAGSLTPKLALGARHDGGDAETGFGVELGGGLAWRAPKFGLAFDLEGRTLLAHASDDLKDQGFAASLAYQPDPVTRRGPSVSLRQNWGGQATGGLEALFAPNPLTQRRGNAATSRWTAEAAWGFTAFGGRFTGSPQVGLSLAPGTRDYRVGWQLTPVAPATSAGLANAAALSVGVTATRREISGAAPEHGLRLEMTTRW